MLDVLLLALAPTLGLQVPSPVRVRTTPWPSANSGAGIASDGTWVAGTSSGARKQPQAFRWGAALGFEGLVGMPYEARAISDDGQRVMARFPTPSHYASGTTAVWSPQGVRYFPGGGPFETYAYAEGMRMSRNGRYVAGWSEPGVPPPGSVTLELGWVWDTEADLVRVLRSDWNGVTRALDVS